MPISSINPFTGETVRTFVAKTNTEIEETLEDSWEAFRTWRKTGFSERANMMQQVAKILEARKEEYARLMAIEMGKPITAGEAEVSKCASGARFYAENAEAFLRDEKLSVENAAASVRYQPLGPVLAIMPWNFPFWQVIRFAAPAIMAGNVALLKHASNVPQCALALEELFRQAGFPQHVFQTMLIESDKVARVIEDPRVAAATLTGSEGAGSKVAAAAGRALKKTVLELGGSAPFIVLPSANLDEAAQTAAKARCVNSGQSCIAAKRFIVHEEIYDAFSSRFIKAMEALKMGNPIDEKTEVGPLATREILATLEDQVGRLIDSGARVLTGGKKWGSGGYFYEPTVIDRLSENEPTAQEEFFGPVALLFKARDIEHAIFLANSTSFGLGASVWTSNPAEQEQLIHELEAGQVFVNAMVASDPRLPFGGVKRSGYGRELGRWGIHEFVNVKTVYAQNRA